MTQGHYLIEMLVGLGFRGDDGAENEWLRVQLHTKPKL